jgi:hypothetical protein
MLWVSKQGARQMTNLNEMTKAVKMINAALRSFEASMSDDEFRHWMSIPEHSRKQLAYDAHKQAQMMFSDGAGA